MGIETAIIGSAILGGVASVAGANKQANAAKKATAAQTDASQKQLDLSKEIYYDQRGLQQPYYQAGLQGLYGSSGVMNLLGMGQPQAQPQPAGQSQLVNVGGGAMMQGGQGQPMVQAGGAMPGNAFAQYGSGTYGQAPISQAQTGPDWNAYLQSNPDVMQAWAQASKTPHLRNMGITTPQQWAEYHYNTAGKAEGRNMGAPQAQQPQTQAPQTQAPTTGTESPTGPTEGPMTQTLRQTPGYQFLQDEGKRQVENSFASRGKLLSGSAMTALQDRSMGVADQTYQQSVNNAFNLANIGMGAAAQIQGAGSNYGAMAGNAFANIGNAQAGGALGQANAWNAGAQGLYGAAQGGLGMYGGYKGWFQ